MWTPTSCPATLETTRSSSCHSACSSVGRIIVRKAISRCNMDLQSGRSRCWRSTSFKKAIAVKLNAKLNNTSDPVKLYWDSVHASNVCEGGLTNHHTSHHHHHHEKGPRNQSKKIGADKILLKLLNAQATKLTLVQNSFLVHKQ